jgi:hypothetical protein
MERKYIHAAGWMRLLVLSAALVAGGCASRGRAISSDGAANEVQITVENQNFKDAVVYAIWGAGTRDRLGMVTGNTTQTLTAPVRGGGDLRIEVDFIAGNDVVTESIGTFRGDRIQVTIPPGAQ